MFPEFPGSSPPQSECPDPKPVCPAPPDPECPEPERLTPPESESEAVTPKLRKPKGLGPCCWPQGMSPKVSFHLHCWLSVKPPEVSCHLHWRRSHVRLLPLLQTGALLLMFSVPRGSALLSPTTRGALLPLMTQPVYSLHCRPPAKPPEGFYYFHLHLLEKASFVTSFQRYAIFASAGILVGKIGSCSFCDAGL